MKVELKLSLPLSFLLKIWLHKYGVENKGDRLVKKSRYIPKHLLARLQRLEAEKVPVRKILEVLGVKG